MAVVNYKLGGKLLNPTANDAPGLRYLDNILVNSNGDLSVNILNYNELNPQIKGTSTTMHYFLPAQGDVTQYSIVNSTTFLPDAGYEMLLVSNGWLGVQQPIIEPASTATGGNIAVVTKNGGLGHVNHDKGEITSYSLNCAEDAVYESGDANLHIIVLHSNAPTPPTIGGLFNVYGNIKIGPGKTLSAYEKLLNPIPVEEGDIIMLGIQQKSNPNTFLTQVSGIVSASVVIKH